MNKLLTMSSSKKAWLSIIKHTRGFYSTRMLQSAMPSLNYKQSKPSSLSIYLKMSALAASALLAYNLSKQIHSSEWENDDEDKKAQNANIPAKKFLTPFSMPSKLDHLVLSELFIYQDLFLIEMEIPEMLTQQQKRMKKELDDVSEEQLKKLDLLTDDQIDTIEGYDEKEQAYIDRGGFKFRKIKVMSPDDIKNGMKVQVSIWSPEDKNTFLPIDKVIIYKHNDKFYTTSSFCGFDYTNLNDGIYVGNKIICPTCGSTYNMTDGMIDQGPAMRNINSFPTQIRKKKVEVIVPDHIPAFAMRENLNKENIDPRTIIIIGDSEAALSAIVTLRYSFVGNIILVPTSTSGSFENKDILFRKFDSLDKSEVYYVEPDLFEKAGVEVINSKINKIDHDERVVYFSNNKKVEFDSILFAGSASRPNPIKQYSNVHQIFDYESHAKAHNSVLKSNHTCVIGSTFEAFQLAMSIRKRLNSIGSGFEKIKITILDDEYSDVEKTLGAAVTQRVFNEFKFKYNINIITNIKIISMDGDHKLEKISFMKPEEKEQEYYIKPDCIIFEKNLGRVNHTYWNKIFFDKPRFKPSVDENEAFKIDNNFQIIRFMKNQGMFACGQNAQCLSFLNNESFRTADVKYNIEAGFYAALNMLYKDIRMEYLPLTRLTIGDKELYYYGERSNKFDDIEFEGDPLKDDKFIAYYSRNGVVCGILTFGYRNLHLYLMEAMKILSLPTISELRWIPGAHKSIVSMVISSNEELYCKRLEMLKVRSTLMGVKADDVERVKKMRGGLKTNIKNEKERNQKEQKQKAEEIKKKNADEVLKKEIDYAQGQKNEMMNRRSI